MAKIPSKAGSPISKKHAKELTEHFKTRLKTKNKATYYSWDVFERLKSLPGCVGIRIYPGLEHDVFTPVLIAVDADGNNIYYDSSKVSLLADDNVLLSSIEERGGVCPPYCPENDL